jgi:hypothetical protein
MTRTDLTRKAVLWLLVLAGIAVWRAAGRPMSRAETVMRRPAPGYGIVAYELAFSKEKAGKILEVWGTEGRAAARKSLSWDFLYIVGYVVALWALTTLFALWSAGKTRIWGARLALIPFVAGALDGIENILLLSILKSPEAFPAFAPLAAGICASLKFALLLFVPLYWVLAAVRKIFAGLARIDA